MDYGETSDMNSWEMLGAERTIVMGSKSYLIAVSLVDVLCELGIIAPDFNHPVFEWEHKAWEYGEKMGLRE
jgi:hypothetical protein